MLASDFGDAPAPYPTLLADNGASHEAVGPQLGPTRSFDVDGLPSPAADADASDDGVTFGEVRVGQLDATVTVNVQNAPAGAKLDAWIDFNGDGSWGGAGERIFASVAVAEGDNLLKFHVPADAQSGAAFARFRLSTTGDLGVRGATADGEVEDYRLFVEPPLSSGGVIAGENVIATSADGAKVVFAADMDGDGDLDVLSASYRDERIAWYENDGQQNFIVRTISTSASGVQSVSVADLDGDGDLDILAGMAGRSAGGYIGDKIVWYENNGDQYFIAHAISAERGSAESVIAADVDNDGDLDIVSAWSGRLILSGSVNDRIVWYENDGIEGFSAHTISNRPNDFRGVTATDFDGDGDLDILAGATRNDKVVWFDNDGAQNFITRRITDIGNGASGVIAMDMDDDGDLDVLTASLSNRIIWYENRGSSYYPGVIIPNSSHASSVFTADMDGDGDLDILTASEADNQIAWYENEDAQSFTAHTISTVAYDAQSVFVADVDGDGDLDVLSASFNDDKIAWYENVYEVEVSSAGASISEAGEAPLIYTISLNRTAVAPVMIRFSLSSPLAVAGVDYSLSGAATFDGVIGTVEIPAGASSVDLVAAPLDDALFELDEPLTASLLESEGYVLGTQGSSTQIITSDEFGADFGDAPAPYSTTLFGNGAAHNQGTPVTPRLGTAVTLEPDGQPSAFADADSGDDGVDFEGIRVGQLGATVTVNVQGAAGELDAWIDFNGDGSWGGAGEQVFASLPVTLGDNLLAFDVPSWAKPGATYARFRVSTAGNLGLDSVAPDGEVEDYRLVVEAPAPSGAIFAGDDAMTTAANGATDVFAADLDGDGDLDVLSASYYDDKIAWYENDGAENYTAHSISTQADGARSVFAADVDGDGDLDVLSASETDNKIAWYENDGARNFTAHTISAKGYKARSVFAADVDGDGDLDVLSANASINFLRDYIVWHENDGMQNFTAHTISGEADGAQSVFAADVDGDGDLDVLSASNSDDKIAWYENDGTQNFTTHTISTDADGAYDVFAADVDGDGDLDVLSASYSDDKIAWYENDGEQGFTARTISTEADGARSVFAADVDGDGDLDVLSASIEDDKIAWYENDGAANFTAHIVSTEVDGVQSVFAGDVDGDGDLDVLSASFNGDTVAWYKNVYGVGVSSDEAFVSEAGNVPLIYTISINRTALAPVPIHFTVTSELAVVGVDYTLGGVATFDGVTGAVEIPVGASSVDLVVSPLDDALYELNETVTITLLKDDHYTVAGMGASSQIIVSDEYGADFGDAPEPYPTALSDGGAAHNQASSNSPRLGAAISFESDGQPSSSADSDAGDDGVTFGEVRAGQLGASVTVNVQGAPGKLDAWIDFNGDGSWGGLGEHVFASAPVVLGDNLFTFDVPSWAKSGATYARFRLSTAGDLAIGGVAPDGEVEDYRLSIESPKSPGGVFASENAISTDANGANSVFAADIDGDGDLDVLSASYWDNKIAWYENDGEENYTLHTITASANGAQAVFVADVDGDGDLDVLSASSLDDKIAWYENDGEENFTAHTISTTTDGANSLFAADMDADGDLDIVSASVVDDTIAWYENDGVQEFSKRVIATDADAATSVFVADVDRDGDLDILSASYSDDKIAWYENDGNQNFTTRVITTEADGAESVFAADVDGDGDFDVLSASSVNDTIAWYENDGGQTFVSHTISASAQAAVSVYAADMDGDGDVDVLSASLNDDRIAWYENDGDENFAVHTISAMADRASQVVAADIDGDGDLDVLSASTDDDKIAWYENTFKVQIASAGESVSEEAGAPLVYTISVSGIPFEPLTLPFSISGLATSGVDYTLSGAATFDGALGTIVVPEGTTSAQLLVHPTDDSFAELEETVTVAIIEGNYMIAVSGLATQAITSGEVGADFGDAPAPYPTLLANGGAAHNQSVADSPRLGPTRDFEQDGQPSPNADTDLGDDGVTFGEIRVGQFVATVTVNVQGGAGKLDAWIDFNGDGSWFGIGEQIFVDEPVAPGDNLLSFDVPVTAVSNSVTFARFRVSTAGGLGVGGVAADGEVEDYAVVIEPPVRTTGVFNSESTLVATPSRNFPAPLTPLDLDRDGDLDFITFSGDYSSTWYWHENRGAEGYVEHEFDFQASAMTPVDFDHDGDLDFIVGGRSGAPNYEPEIAWLENDGNQVFTKHVLSTEVSDPRVIAVADFNGDGRLDFAVADNDRAVTWFESLAQGEYAQRNIVSAASATNLIATDLDSDGDVDLVASRPSTSADTVWYENDGEGLFTKRLIDYNGVTSFEVVDLDRDGDQDIVAMSHNFSSANVEWFENDGAQNFTTNTIGSFEGSSRELALKDFDGDGDYDIAALSRYAGSFDPAELKYFENLGSNSFAEVELAPSSVAGTLLSIAPADVDGNGTIDLAVYGQNGIAYFAQPYLATAEVVVASVPESESEAIVFRLHIDVAATTPISAPFTLSGTATLGVDYTIEGADSVDGAAGIATIPAGASFVELTIHPIEDDLPELAETVSLSLGDKPEQQAAGVILGDPTYGDYGDAPAPFPTTPLRGGAAHVAVGPTLGAVRTTESTGANSPAANGDAGDDGVTFAPLYVGQGDAQLTVNVQNTTETARLDGWIDFNGDGAWAAADERIFTSIEVSPGDNTLRFTVPGGAVPGQTFARLRLSTAGGLGPQGDATDGEVEDYAVTISPASDRPVNFAPAPIEEGSQVVGRSIPIDFDHDGDIDIVTVPTSYSDPLMWLENNGSEEFTSHTILALGFEFVSDLAIGDIDGDGDYDLVAGESNYLGGQIAWLENDGAFNFVLRYVAPTTQRQRSLSLADMDGDGDLDITSVAYGGRNVPYDADQGLHAWYENNGSGVFTEHVIDTFNEYSYYHEAVDMDRDGDLDFLVSHTHRGEIYWYENDGEQAFKRRTVSAGDTDLPYSPFSQPGGPVHAADLDGDGDLDVVAGPSGYGLGLRWYENLGANRFVECTISDALPRALQVTTADLDGDGDFDLLLGGVSSLVWVENRIAGDLNNDGAVDSNDSAFWRANYGATAGAGLQADMNGDATVDAIDYALWRESLNAPASRRFALVANPSGITSSYLTPTDLDGDGDLDLVGAYGGRSTWFANSAAVELVGGAATASEAEQTTLTYTVSRDSRLTEELDVAIEFSGSAKGGIDFTAAGIGELTTEGGVLTIPAGVDSASFTLTIVDDSFEELEEIFHVKLVPSSDYAVGANLPLETTVVSDEFGGDFGDAPAPFPTSPNMDGPRHSRILATDPRLGATRSDVATATTENTDVTDDGVVFGDLHVGALGGGITVNVQGGDGLLDAWIDFNGDGSWGGPGERVFINQAVTVGDNQLSFDVPSWASLGETYARFRISTAGGLTTTGFSEDGETEDYAVEILPPAIATGQFASGRVIASTVDGPNSVYAVDLDRDGDLDYVSASGIDGVLAWHENDGQQVFTEHFVSDFGEGMWDLTVEDFDADNDWDIVVALKGTSNRDRIYFYRNNGDQVFNRSHNVASNVFAPSSLFPVDMDGDGDMDLVSAAIGDDEVTWYENYSGQGYFRREEVTSTADGANDVVAVDLDRDGDMDLVAALLYDDAFLWFENDGLQGFTEHSIATGADGAASIFVTDLDRDGDLDIVGTSLGDDSLTWYENDGAQNFAPHVIDDTADGVSHAVAADVDGDGDLDIAAAVTTLREIRVYRNDGSQQFTSQTISTTATGVSDLLAADADGDGDLDLVATVYGSDQILWYENYLPGDYSRDLEVTSSDFALFQSSFGDSGESFHAADGNSDGAVDAVDYAIWRENLGASLLQAGNTASNGDENSDSQTEVGALTATLSLSAFPYAAEDSLPPSRSNPKDSSLNNRKFIQSPLQSENLLLLALDHALARSVNGRGDSIGAEQVKQATRPIDDDSFIDDGLLATDEAFNGIDF